jgi:hypothetical protein
MKFATSFIRLPLTKNQVQFSAAPTRSVMSFTVSGRCPLLEPCPLKVCRRRSQICSTRKAWGHSRGCAIQSDVLRIGEIVTADLVFPGVPHNQSAVSIERVLRCMPPGRMLTATFSCISFPGFLSLLR